MRQSLKNKLPPTISLMKGGSFLSVLCCTLAHCLDSTIFGYAAYYQRARGNRSGIINHRRIHRARQQISNSRVSIVGSLLLLLAVPPPTSPPPPAFFCSVSRVSFGLCDANKFPFPRANIDPAFRWLTTERRLTDDDGTSRRSSFVSKIFNRKY